jgi:hypothetical protein
MCVVLGVVVGRSHTDQRRPSSTGLTYNNISVCGTGCGGREFLHRPGQA